jgi:hypothetical protein
MKRKRWRIVEIMLGVLLLLFVLIGPAVASVRATRCKAGMRGGE